MLLEYLQEEVGLSEGHIKKIKNDVKCENCVYYQAGYDVGSCMYPDEKELKGLYIECNDEFYCKFFLPKF